MNILDMISNHAKVDKIAHIYRESKMSYKELSFKSDALASFIIKELNCRKAPVIIYGHKEHLMLISFLACIKAGQAYIPIDSSTPEERIRDIINDSKTALILNISNNLIDGFNDNLKSKEEIEDIISNFGGRIPDYMIPRKFIIKEILPMNINGKVNRKQLAEEL